MSNDLAVKKSQLTNAVKQMSDYLKDKIDDNTTQLNGISKVVTNRENELLSLSKNKYYELKDCNSGDITISKIFGRSVYKTSDNYSDIYNKYSEIVSAFEKENKQIKLQVFDASDDSIAPKEMIINLDEPLRSLHSYKDVLDLENKKIIRKIGVYKITGNENWTLSESYSTDNILCAYAKVFNDNTHPTGLICNCFKPWHYKNGANANTIALENDSINISVPKSSLATPDIDGLKAYLRTKKATVLYKLSRDVETPVDIDSNIIQAFKNGNKIKINTIFDIKVKASYDKNISNVTEIDDNKKLSEITVKLSDFMDDGLTHSQCIDNALAFVDGYDMKTIIFDVQQLTIDKAILLGSNTTVKLVNCSITQKDRTFDNVFRGKNIILDDNDKQYVPEDIEQLYNIRIIGEGNCNIIGCTNNQVDGQGRPMTGHSWGGRTLQIVFQCVNGFELGGINFEKTRCWCCEFEFLENFYIHDLKVNSPNVPNGDGVAFRSGCKHGKVENISGATGDDSICLNSHQNFKTYPIKNSFKFPMEYTYRYAMNRLEMDERALDIHDISFNNIEKTGGRYHIAILLAMFGRKIYDISFNNLRASGNIELPGDNSYISCYNFTPSGSSYSGDLDFPASDSDFTKGDISNIRFNNVETDCTTGGTAFVSLLPLKNFWVNKLIQRNTSAKLTNDLVPDDDFKLTNSKIEEKKNKL